MTNLLQEKLQRQKESKFVEEFKKNLTAFECFATMDESDFPQSLHQVIEAASKIDTPRQSRIAQEKEHLISFPGSNVRYMESVVGDTFSWVERMFIESGIRTERFYLSTPFRFFPWIDCKIADSGWIKNLSSVCDLNFSVISHDKRIFLSIENGEHWLEAYCCNL